MLNQSFIEIPSIPSLAFTNNNRDNSLLNTLSNPMALTLIGIFGLYGLLSLMGNGSKKGKLSTAYWGGKREKKKAQNIALSQINEPTRNSASLYIGTPDTVLLKLQEQWLWSGLKFNEQRKAASHPI